MTENAQQPKSLFERVEDIRVIQFTVQQQMKKLFDYLCKQSQIEVQEGYVKIKQLSLKTITNRIREFENQIELISSQYEDIFNDMNNQVEDFKNKLKEQESDTKKQIEAKMDLQKQIENMQRDFQKKEEDYKNNIRILSDQCDKTKNGWVHSVDQMEISVHNSKLKLAKNANNQQEYLNDIKKDFLSTFDDIDTLLKSKRQKPTLRNQTKITDKENIIPKNSMINPNTQGFKQFKNATTLPRFSNMDIDNSNITIPNQLFGKLSPINAFNQKNNFNLNILKERDLNIPQNSQNMLNQMNMYFKQSQQNDLTIEDSQDSELFFEVINKDESRDSSRNDGDNSKWRYDSKYDDVDEQENREFQNQIKKVVVFISKIKDEINKEKEQENQIQSKDITNDILFDKQFKEEALNSLMPNAFKKKVIDPDLEMSYDTRMSSRSDLSENEGIFEKHVQQEDICKIQQVQSIEDQLFPQNNDDSIIQNFD